MKTNQYNKIAIGFLVALALLVGIAWPQYQKYQVKKQTAQLKNLNKSMANQDEETAVQTIVQYIASHITQPKLQATSAGASMENACSNAVREARRICRIYGEEHIQCDWAWENVQRVCGSIQARGTNSSGTADINPTTDTGTMDSGMMDTK